MWARNRVGPLGKILEAEGTDVASLSAVACWSWVWVLCLLCCQMSCLPIAEAEASHCCLVHSVLGSSASFPL